MTTGDLITQPWQIQRRDLLMGDGTEYDIVQIAGAAGTPATVPSDRALAQRDGSIAGQDWLSSRAMTITFEIVDNDTGSMTAKLDALSRAMAPTTDPEPLAIRLPGVANATLVTTNVHVRRRSVPIDNTFAHGVARATFQVSSADPLFYSIATTTTTAQASGGTSTVGLTFPATFDLSFGGAITPGAVEVTNNGNYDAPFTFRIYGPVQDPVLTRASDGAFLAFTKTLATSADFLEVKTDDRTVTLGGTLNAYSTLDADSTWFDLIPGSNDLRLTRTGSGAATIAVYSRHAYA